MAPRDAPTLDDHLRALGVKRDATPAQISDAYRAKVASRLHPDNGGDPFGWQRYQKAYDTLIDERRRAECEGGEGEDDDDEDDDYGEASSSDEADEAWASELEPFDLLEALGVRLDEKSGDVVGGATRVRACFFREAAQRPRDPERYESAEAYEQAVLKFRRICVAFLALRDAARRQIYASCGFEGLKASETYQDASIFEAQALRVREDFFAGVDEGDREFMLLNGGDRADDGFEDADGGYAKREARRREAAARWERRREEEGEEGEEEAEEEAEEGWVEDVGDYDEEDDDEDEEDEEDEDEEEDNEEDDEEDLELLAAAAREPTRAATLSVHEASRLRKRRDGPLPAPPAAARELLGSVAREAGEGEAAAELPAGGWESLAARLAPAGGRGAARADGDRKGGRPTLGLGRQRQCEERRGGRRDASRKALGRPWWRAFCDPTRR